MARLNELWRSVDGPGVPPGLDVKRVKARVNAALDADQAERKIYMKQKLRMALIAAAAVAALTGSAFAATANWNGLSSWFRGDTAPALEYIHNSSQTVSDENYSMTVEGSAADDYTAYLTVTFTALSDEAKEFIHSDDFNSIDLLYVHPVREEKPADEDDGLPRSFSIPYQETESPGENSRRFEVSLQDLSGPVDAVQVWCGYMETDKRVTLPITPAPTLTLKLGVSGPGTMNYIPVKDVEENPLTISEVTISPFTCLVKWKCFADGELYPNLRFRMADGTVLTQSQMMNGQGGSFNNLTGSREYLYQFHEVQALDGTGIVSIIAFDMEYPLDGSKPAPVEHDSALDPFTVARMEKLSDKSGYSVPVRELTEKLGGTCDWDPATGSVTCVYRGVTVVLKAGDAIALVDGRPVDMVEVPAEQNGVLAADWLVFQDAWSINGFVQRENIYNEKDPADATAIDVTTIWGDWYIIP